MILSKKAENVNRKENWLKEKLTKTGNTIYNVCIGITTIMTLMNYGL